MDRGSRPVRFEGAKLPVCGTVFEGAGGAHHRRRRNGLASGGGGRTVTERQAPFGRRLDAAVQAKGSPVVLGLDPRPALLPEAVLMEAAGRHGATRFGAAAAIEAFERAVIEAAAPYVVAVKPQLA